MLEIDDSEKRKLLHEETTGKIIGAAFEVHVAVEIKVAPQYDKRDEAQFMNELKATRLNVGMLVNFGRTKVEYKRLVF